MCANVSKVFFIYFGMHLLDGGAVEHTGMYVIHFYKLSIASMYCKKMHIHIFLHLCSPLEIHVCCLCEFKYQKGHNPFFSGRVKQSFFIAMLLRLGAR